MALDSDAEAAILVKTSDARQAFKPFQRQQRLVILDFDATRYRAAESTKAFQ